MATSNDAWMNYGASLASWSELLVASNPRSPPENDHAAVKPRTHRRNIAPHPDATGSCLGTDYCGASLPHVSHVDLEEGLIVRLERFARDDVEVALGVWRLVVERRQDEALLEAH